MTTDLSTIGAALAGRKTASLTPANIAMICKLTKDGTPTGKPLAERSKIEAVLGARTDEYFRHICGGNNVANTLIRMMGWWA